jgi:hypothetical protein
MVTWAQAVLMIGAASILLTGCGATAHGTSPALAPTPRSGDLIFLDLDCGAICDAIEEVTRQQLNVDGPRLSHVGLVEQRVDGTYVIEAWPEGGVRRTALRDVLGRVRQPQAVRWGELLPRYRALGAAAVARAARLLGTPYDDEFLLDNRRLYCSELVYEAFRAANGGRPVFPLSPMRFGSPGSSARRTWEDYYRRRGSPVPDGQPGLSPLGIYLHGRRELFAPPAR